MAHMNENHVLDRPFTIVLSFDSEVSCWVAHCLEFDIVEDGKTQKEALIHLFKIMRSNVREALRRNALKDIFQFAPKEYWAQALAARPIRLEEIIQPKRLSPFFIPPQKLDLKLISSRA